MTLHKPIQNADVDPHDRQGFAHFMLKEIYEQPDVVRQCLAAYLKPGWDSDQDASLSSNPFNLALPDELFATVSEIQLVACGTSRHASLVAQYWFEQLAGIPTRVRSASEFVSAPFPLARNTLTIAVTQSGETADTLAAIAAAKRRSSPAESSLQSWLLGITNQSESSLTKAVDYTLPTLAGTEVGVAATKTFMAQLVVFCCLALEFAFRRQALSPQQLAPTIAALRSLPDQIETTLQHQHEPIQTIAQTFANVKDCIVLGRGINHAIALEGALKLKETTYIHAEGYAGGEFMHGPIALLDATVPVIAIAPAGSVYDSMLANTEKAKANGAPLIGITTVTEPADRTVFAHPLTVPAIDELLSPFLTVVPLQLLAYTIAVQRGLDVDRPRNITKTLTR
ncbi:isomerizing glutamine--fructose-6-phosphate transaminase [Phormidium sp. FACHB-592]|uniref:Glutamine--fructose-6-phosphate aminotransferase [isomerizing] n=1 Tax=Stenomitos frigidus AS-A4 TaxID=2933935 RepID=A0ABV0KR50_9CYAN|nr:isomerizing glutamine--fructose-6-phosphate transaminase [Phormidium sp. FACHB-592]MBD2075547.1 isomerizing glutamine--fructose-6-phosphate transaminase [Phormidium sp. FACHB-592]